VNLELRIALERLVYLKQIRDHVLAAFGPGAPKARLRHSEVTKLVAEAMGREFSPSLGRDVLQAMKAHGWRAVHHDHRPYWKGIARR